MVVVPVFYGSYTAVGLVNTIIYLDEIGNYPPWAIVLVFVGIGVLIYGVYLLSSKPDPAHMNELPPPQELEEMVAESSVDHTHDSLQWLSAKDEKEAVHKMIGESSTLKESQGGRVGKFFRKLKLLTTLHHPVPRREMDTFISLNSNTTTIIPLAISSSSSVHHIK